MNDDTTPTIQLLSEARRLQDEAKARHLLGETRASKKNDLIQKDAFGRVKDSLFRSAKRFEEHSVLAEELVDWGTPAR